MFRIVYQSYGSNSIYTQTLFSIFTLKYFLDEGGSDLPYQIIVYTDNAEVFSKYKIDTSIISQQEIQEWKGKYNFIHRVKIKIIEDVIKKYSDTIIYIDSDTYFLKSPIELFNSISTSNSLMLTNEGEISKTNHRLLYKFLSKNNFDVKNRTLFMWNAGLIGIHKSNLHLIKQILELTDDIYEKFYRHIVEQFSFSYLLQINTRIISCDDYLYHYCGDKDLVLEIISQFLETQELLPIMNVYKNSVELEPFKKINKREKTIYEKFIDVFIRLRKSINKRAERIKNKL